MYPIEKSRSGLFWITSGFTISIFILFLPRNLNWLTYSVFALICIFTVFREVIVTYYLLKYKSESKSPIQRIMFLRILSWVVFGILVLIQINIADLMKTFPDNFNLGLIRDISTTLFLVLLSIVVLGSMITNIDEEWGVGTSATSNIPYFGQFDSDPVNVSITFMPIGNNKKGYRIEYKIDGELQVLYYKHEKTSKIKDELKAFLSGITVQRIRGIKVKTHPNRIFYPSSLTPIKN